MIIEDFAEIKAQKLPVMKVEKPGKVVKEKRKSFSALFLETLHKTNFSEPPCRGGVRILKNAPKAKYSLGKILKGEKKNFYELSLRSCSITSTIQ